MKRRDKILKILNEGELAAINASAAANSLTRAEYCRQRVARSRARAGHETQLAPKPNPSVPTLPA
jgi:hypothetical protein